ncbi:MAG: DUF5060 domain-containing protein [bacterium]|nr:DUF5060 domain-containing protein [bacterium]
MPSRRHAAPPAANRGWLALLLSLPLAAQQVTIDAPDGLRRWHRIGLLLDGPSTAEGATPNPFLDRRMQVFFTHPASTTSYEVPGHFAADGQAAETSATVGSVWRAWFAPDRVGTWTWRIEFRTGPEVAVSLSPTAGSPLAPFDGLTGTFTVTETDKTGRDFRGRGRLHYVDRHHLQFADGSWFLKAGADSPENLLAYEDFDNTPNIGNRRKAWAPHAGDWQTGDASWQNGKGTELIGALNYLASEGLNAVSFLTYSHNGDDKNVFPYVDPNDPRRLDCSKLDQWEAVFAHADRIGLYLHFKTQETENDQDLDGGSLGVERRLYYRELVSRFGHHLALNWNLGEENTNTTGQRIAFAQYFRDVDPYDHHIVVHTYPGQKNAVYTPLLGAASDLTGASLQSGPSSVFGDTLSWRQRSATAGKPWVCANDEQGNAQTGIRPDANDPTHDGSREDVLWGNLMAGGAGIECYFGYGYAHSDLTCQDFRSRDVWWDQCRHALEFFTANRVPYWDMANSDALVNAGHCLAGADQFVVYLPNGGSPTLDLTSRTGTFAVRWFDPRNGGALQSGGVVQVLGGANRTLGAPPAQPTADWVVLIRPTAFVPATEVRYGQACSGSPGLPNLVTTGPAVAGHVDFAIRVTNVLPTTYTALAIGFTRAATPLGGGCSLLVGGPIIDARFSDAGGVARFALPLPPSPTLPGLQLTFAGAALDPAGAFAATAAFTAGVEITVGG